ncbi:MAG: NUDIX hydrolase [Bacilli bacterium]
MLSDAWGFPAGKVKYEEAPLQALDREAQEELNLRVELISDDDEHRHRIVSRVADIAGLTLPTWEEVARREDCLRDGIRL